MEHVLRYYIGKFVTLYIDDILIFSASFEDHLIHVAQVLQTLREAYLKVRINKCPFARNSVEFLGHLITSEGIGPNKRNIEAVTSFPTLAKINPLPDLTEFQKQQQKIQCIYNIDNPLDINTLSTCVTIHNVDNQVDINTLPDCVTDYEKQRANPSVEKETPVNDHTLSYRVINRSTQSVAHSRKAHNFANTLDHQKTSNENISADTRQTLFNGSNIYLMEQMKKHRHRIGKPEFLIKWLGYLNHPNTWKPEDHSPPALVQEHSPQSPLENPAPTNAVLLKSDIYQPCQLLLNKKPC